MRKIRKTEYDLYLSGLVFEALETMRKKGMSTVHVHTHMDAVVITNMLDDLTGDYPEARKIDIELCQIQ
jgi:hypothetical protein